MPRSRMQPVVGSGNADLLAMARIMAELRRRDSA